MNDCPLTRLQLDILENAALGLTNAQIAARFAMSEWAVAYRLRTTYDSLDANDRTQAVATAIRRKWIVVDQHPLRRVLTVDDPRHGTVNGYDNLGCRCQPCRDAWAAYCTTRRRNRPPLPPEDPRHGNPSTYRNWACRCEACTRANSAAKKEARARG